jgi:cytochrome c oxidase subunit I
MEQRRQVRRWLGVAAGSLLLSGVLSLFLVVGRAPGLHHLFSDPYLFRRCLVVHVDLALIVWFGAFFAALYHLIPSRHRLGGITAMAPLVAAVGVVIMVLSAGISGAEPILANYVPVVDHPVFIAGLVVFGLGLVLGLAPWRLWTQREVPHGILPVSGAVRAGLRAGAVVVVVTALTFAGSALVTPTNLSTHTYYELVAWGGGHTLQFVSVLGMLVVWLLLLEAAIGGPVVGRATAAGLFSLLALPTLVAPLLTVQGTDQVLYHAGFTTMMRWGTWPVVLVFMGLGVRAVLSAREQGRLPDNPLRDPRVAAVTASACLATAGFILGALIRGPSTLIPAHYHASIGAVTVAYMAMTPTLLRVAGMPLPVGRLSRSMRWQPVAFGAGQLIFAAGFGFAGAHGMARKTYAGEQQIRSVGESIGLGVMGLGGVVAVVAGVIFLAVIARAWLTTRPDPLIEQGATIWKSESIRSRG